MSRPLALRINNSNNPLDASSVYPEFYEIVGKMSVQSGQSVEALIGDTVTLKKIDLTQFTTEKTGLLTLNDIIREFQKTGRDPSLEFKIAALKEGVETLKDLNPECCFKAQ